MYNYLIILLIIIIILGIIYFFIRSNRDFRIKYGVEINFNKKESFSNQDIHTNANSNLKIDYNLIQNNCFENQRNLSNFINQNGPIKIMSFQNPGNSSYVLKQNYKSLYEISCNNSINSSYLLYFYFSIENDELTKFNFDDFIKIRMPTKDYSNYIPKINYNIEKKIELNDKNTWYYVKVNYHSNENVLDKQIITFNNNQEHKTIYLTNVSLFKVLHNAPNFKNNQDLICFIDCIDYNSNNNILHDISGNNNDLYLSNIPKKNDDYIELTNTKIDGFPSNHINSDKFTLILTLNKIEENINTNAKLNNKEKVLLSIQGNNNFCFELLIIDDYIYLKQENKKIKSDKQLNYFNKSILTILYDGNLLNIYNDNMNILSHKINKIYMNNKPILLNKNQNMNVYLYNFLVFNRMVETNELKEIRDYFITNQNKKKNDILDITFDNIYKNNSNNLTIVDGFDNSKKKIENFYSSAEESFEEEHINNDYKLKMNCIQDCNQICQKFLNGSENQIENYKNCLKNCSNVTNSCKSYCETSDDPTYCDNNDISPNSINNNNNNNNKCPKVYKKNGKYIVYIPENGLYSGFFTGEKIFSSDIDKARNMYAYNFPDCPIPRELIVDSNKYQEYCPFTINELNPCNARVCSNVNWNVENYKDLKIDDKCKKVISNYCHINYDKDENCKCWDPKYKNDKACIEYKRFFENPNDYCNIASYKIEEHPDIKKYVKKDNIPCWGCNLSK